MRFPFSPSRRCTAVLAAAAVSVLPCTFAGAEPAAPAPAPASAPAPAAEVAVADEAPEITWEECPEQVDEETARCGRITVPTYYDAPENGNISVGFVHVPAANPAAKRGTIFGNPGGPGGDAYSYFGNSMFELPESIVQEFDRVAVQPRGLIGSTPVKCDEREDFDLIQSSVNPGAFIRDNCEYSTPGYTASLTTENTAQDWEMVRRALDEERISILGLSYGTYLGSAYATLFPEHTDKLVLDSAMSPDLVWNGVVAAQQEGFENALHDLFQFIADRDATYHLGVTPLAVYEKWSQKVASEAGITPTVLPPDAEIGDLPPGLEFAGQPGADLITGTGEIRVQAEYLARKAVNPQATQITSPTLNVTRTVIPDPSSWEQFAEYVAGTSPLPVPMGVESSISEEEQVEALEYLNNFISMQNLLVCNENAVPANPLALPKWLWSALVLQDPFTVPNAMWESGLKCRGHEPVTTPIQVNGDQLETQPLQLNGTGDPQTPYQFAGTLRDQMGAHMVTVHGPGHGHVGTGNDAVNAIVDEYLRTGSTEATDAPGYFG